MVEVTKRVYQLHCDAVADGTLLVANFRGVERLSAPFHFDLELVAKNAEVDGDAVLTADCWFGIQLPTILASSGKTGVEMRRIHGVLSHIEQQGRDDLGVHYRATLVPRWWRLSLTVQNRIFQDVSVVDIVKQVLDEHGFEAADSCWRLCGNYPLREYVVQYHESDLAFISRLLEHHGIFYHFEHHDERSVMVFGDQPDACHKLPGNSTLRYRTEVGGTREPGALVEESIFALHSLQRPVTGQVVLGDFNYRTPAAPLYPSAAVKASATFGTRYEYGDHFKNDDEGKGLASVRAEGIASTKRRFRGNGDARGFYAGGVFTLREHFRNEVNIDHLLISVIHQGSQGFATSSNDDHPTAAYSNQFDSMPANEVFRPPITTTKPAVTGPLTAKIDGAADGKYAELDDQGRYKVKFPFDRSDKKDGKASRYVRMAQPYGGDQMGMHFPLHKGTEVLITHVNGDPDRPVIAAAVPNPATASLVTGKNQTQSVIRTGGKNAVVLEDTEGAEEFNIKATRDHLFEIGHDSVISVANDAKESIGANHHQTIGASDNQSVGADRTVSVGANLSQSVAQNQAVMIGVNSAETIGAAKELTIGGAYQVTVGAAMNETVGAAKTEEVGAYKFETVGGERRLEVGESFTVQVNRDHAEEAKDKRHIKAKSILLEASDEIVFSVGKASITLKKDGTIQLDGKDILLQASGKIAGKASSEIKLKGSKIGEN